MNAYGNIRSVNGYLDSIWDWSVLNDCFGDTGIRVTDIDGAVERNGHLLLIETKKPGVPIPKGQRILINNLTATGIVSVFVVWGRRNQPTHFQAFYPHPYGPQERIALVGPEEFQGWVRNWFNYANSTSWQQSSDKARANVSQA